MERLRNVRKRSKDEEDCAVKPKKKKLSPKQSLMKRYPPRLHNDTREDNETTAQHLAAMVSEMGKKKPREIVLLPLLRRTYSARRDFITSTERCGVAEILKEYPGLQIPAAVSN